MPSVGRFSPLTKKALWPGLKRTETVNHEQATRAAARFFDLSLEANKTAATVALHPADRRPTCAWCQRGRLDVIREWHDPMVGTIGVTLKCDAPECAKFTNV
jgi:hypothetical protein